MTHSGRVLKDFELSNGIYKNVHSAEGTKELDQKTSVVQRSIVRKHLLPRSVNQNQGHN